MARGEAEISGWVARQQLLQGQLSSEREASRHQASQLLEAQESVASVRQLLVASKDEQLAEAHKQLRKKEAEVSELNRRCTQLKEQVCPKGTSLTVVAPSSIMRCKEAWRPKMGLGPDK